MKKLLLVLPIALTGCFKPLEKVETYTCYVELTDFPVSNISYKLESDNKEWTDLDFSLKGWTGSGANEDFINYLNKMEEEQGNQTGWTIEILLFKINEQLYEMFDEDLQGQCESNQKYGELLF